MTYKHTEILDDLIDYHKLMIARFYSTRFLLNYLVDRIKTLGGEYVDCEETKDIHAFIVEMRVSRHLVKGVIKDAIPEFKDWEYKKWTDSDELYEEGKTDPIEGIVYRCQLYKEEDHNIIKFIC